VHLIDQNFSNEERFARSFVRGKTPYQRLGTPPYCQRTKGTAYHPDAWQAALQELDSEEYETAFHRIAESHWEHLHDANVLRKRKKFCDYMVRKGWKSDLVQKVKALEQDSGMPSPMVSPNQIIVFYRYVALTGLPIYHPDVGFAIPCYHVFYR